MLVLMRAVGESIYIGDEIKVTVLRSAGGKVRIGIEAPKRRAGGSTRAARASGGAKEEERRVLILMRAAVGLLYMARSANRVTR